MPDVSACIATRGDHDLSQITLAIHDAGIADIVIWDNSAEEDRGPNGRFEAMRRAYHPVIYVQDDDVLVEADSILELIAAYQPHMAVVNMPSEFRPHYPDSAMVGFGAVFDRALVWAAFERFFDYHEDMSDDDPLFLRESCRAFTTLTPLILMDVPKTNLPWASDPDRLWKQPDHVANRERMLALARQVRDA